MYWFLDQKGNVLYVGKAKNLKKRISSYTYLSRLPERTLQLVQTATHLKTKILESELEALLVEAELIRTYRPPYNILLKDDKSPIYIQITNEEFPRVNMVRKKDVISQHLKGTILGPFQTTYKVKEVLRLARDIFPWCNERGGSLHPQKKACFYYHIGLCPGACIGEVSASEYQDQVKELILFLRGKKRQVTTSLQKKMETAAENEQFEDAALFRDQIEIISEVTKPKYRLKPDLLLATTLTSDVGRERVIHLRRILHNYLHLAANYQLKRIEGYDVSNIQGQHASVAMVTFAEGEPLKADYRLFNIKTLQTPNDYHMLKEALLRRQNHPEWGRPDLLVIDGGKGQLRAALSVWSWRSPIISIAKNPDRLIIPDLSDVEPISVENDTHQLHNLQGIKYHILKLPEQHQGLKLVQHIRDEAHRFSKKQFSKRKLKSLLN